MSDTPVSLHDFYGGYFTGPHFPPRPWPEADRQAADARLPQQEEPTDDV